MAMVLPDGGNCYDVLDGEFRLTPVPSSEHQAAIGELIQPPQARSVLVIDVAACFAEVLGSR